MKMHSSNKPNLGTPLAGGVGMKLVELWPTLKQTFSEWSDDKAPKMAAALAYFTVLSLAPLLVIVLKIVAIRYGNGTAADQLHDELTRLAGRDVADALKDLIPKTEHAKTGTIAALLSVGVALSGASGVFAELQDSLNTIWQVEPKPGRGWMAKIRERFLSMAMVFGIAFLLLVSMVLSSAVAGFSTWIIHETLGDKAHVLVAISFIVDIIFSTVAVTVLFAAMFKVLPDAIIKWRDVWLGAGVTAVLFQLGKYGLSLYIGLSKPGVAYGVAGSLVVLLVWVYYSSWILFLGAEFTQVYANKFGSKIVPAPNAQRPQAAVSQRA